jgi:hypothetical protein
MINLKPCSRCGKETANTCLTCKNPLCPACEEDDPMCTECRAKVQDSPSEINRLLETIDLEYQAANRALYGFMQGAAQHKWITERLENIDRMRERMIDIVGDEAEANRLVMEQLDKSGQKPEEGSC